MSTCAIYRSCRKTSLFRAGIVRHDAALGGRFQPQQVAGLRIGKSRLRCGHKSSGETRFSSARSSASSTRLNLRIVGANMLRMTPRLRRLIRTRSCERCGSNLRLERHRKYDSFWIIFLVWLGTAFTFYVVGLLLIGAGLWLWPRRTARWVCPSCTLASPAVSGA